MDYPRPTPDDAYRQRPAGQQPPDKGKRTRKRIDDHNNHTFAIFGSIAFKCSAAEFETPEAEGDDSNTVSHDSYNVCNPSLRCLQTLRPKPPTNRKSSKQSKVWFAVQELHEYATCIADTLYPELDRVFTFPPEVFLLPSLSNLLAREIVSDSFDAQNIAQLSDGIPELQQWDWLDEYGDRLFAECTRIRPVALQKWELHCAHLASQPTTSSEETNNHIQANCERHDAGK